MDEGRKEGRKEGRGGGPVFMGRAAGLKADTLYGNCHLGCPGSTRPHGHC